MAHIYNKINYSNKEIVLCKQLHGYGNIHIKVKISNINYIENKDKTPKSKSKTN